MEDDEFQEGLACVLSSLTLILSLSIFWPSRVSGTRDYVMSIEDIAMSTCLVWTGIRPLSAAKVVVYGKLYGDVEQKSLCVLVTHGLSGVGSNPYTPEYLHNGRD